MFTQFFGNYLLNQDIITSNELILALQKKKDTRLKLGVLAINAGYMDAAQVEIVHEAQTVLDKRFGDIAIEKGFLTEAQLNELLNSQDTGYLLLGQALVDDGVLTNESFANALTAYKEKYQFSDSDLKDMTDDKLRDLIGSYSQFSSIEQADYYIEFIILLLKSLVRFVGDDFSLLDAQDSLTDANIGYVSQKITGDFSSTLTISFETEAILKAFSTRYSQEDSLDDPEFIEAAACDFVNLHNGLYTVNMSNENNIELRLKAPVFSGSVPFDSCIIVLPIQFTFGVVKFILS